MDYCTEAQYNMYLEMGVKRELAMITNQLGKLEYERLLTIESCVKSEVAVVMSIREAFQSVRPLGHREDIDLCDKISDIQRRVFRKTGTAADTGGERRKRAGCGYCCSC